MHHTVVNTKASICKHWIINTDAIIEHDDKIGKFTYFTSGVTIGGATKIGDLCLVGMNSTVRNNIHVTSGVMIGMGELVTRSIEEPGKYTGIPAKNILTKTKGKTLNQSPSFFLISLNISFASIIKLIREMKSLILFS